MEEKLRGHALVLDNDLSFGRFLKTILIVEGYLCTLTGTPEGALEAIAREPFDLLVLELDCPLPGKSGAEVVWEVRQRGLNMPILAMSTFPSRWDPNDLADLGIDYFLPKPFIPEDFSKAVAEVVRTRQQPGQSGSGS